MELHAGVRAKVEVYVADGSSGVGGIRGRVKKNSKTNYRNYKCKKNI
jgi:hypothetical protein